MRGDTVDNVFVLPGVRTKGTKTRVGLTEASREDRNSKGYSWNNMMLQRWVDMKDLNTE